VNIGIYILAGIGAATIVVLLVSLYNNMFRNNPEPCVPMVDTKNIANRLYTVEDYHRKPGVPVRITQADIDRMNGDQQIANALHDTY
jgi:hypothetical protein